MYFEDTDFPFFSDFSSCIYLARWAALWLSKLSSQLGVGKEELGPS